MKEKGRRVSATALNMKKDNELPGIMLVDDSDENLRMFSTVLTNKGYRVITAGNGEEALQKLRKGPPDLILSDILMPVMDGFRLLQECKADPALSHVRFVCLTGAFTDSKDEELGLKLGADAFLRKPIEPDDLASALAEVLSRKPAAKKRGRKTQAGKDITQAGLYNAALMQKLEQKIEALKNELSERKKAEEGLAKSEERYRLLFETTDQGVMYWAGGRVISLNPAAARILGLGQDDLLGLASTDPVWKAFHEDGSDFAAGDFPVVVAAETGRPVRDVTMGFFSSKDERFHWIRVSAIPQFRHGEERPYQVYSTFADITDRFFAFKALQESDSRMSAILENTRDFIWSVDRDYSLTTANDNARRLYNQIYGTTLVEGMDVRSAIPEENRGFWSGIGQRVFNGEQVSFERHLEFADGPIDLEFSLSPIVSPSGRTTGVSCFARDITERRQSEQRGRIRRNLALSLIGITNIETASRLCLDAAIDMAGFDSGVVYILDEDTGDFKAVHYHGISPATVHNLSVLPAGSKWAKLITKGKAFYVKAEEFTPPFDEQLRPEGFTFHSTIPIHHGNRVIASLGVYSHVETDMPDVVRNSLEAIAADIGTAIERIKSRRELQISQERYNVIADNTSDVIWTMDKNLRYTYFSPSVKKQRGYSPEEILQLKVDQVVAPSSIQQIIDGVANAIVKLESQSNTGPVTYTGEMEVSCKDGSTLWTETSFTVIADEHGKFNSLMGISRDITERRSVEQELKVSEQRYRSLFHQNPAITYALDLQGHFTSVNAAAVRITGYSEEEAMKLDFSRGIAPEYLETVEKSYACALKGEPQSYDAAIIAKDGRRIDVHITSTPIIIDGKVTGVYGIAEDITGRKKADEDLRAALENASSILEGTIEAIVLMSELRDPYTAGHQRMVSQLAVAMAREIGMEAERVQDLAVAGLLHDVGKVYVPSEILSKPGKLTGLELGLAKAHAEASYNIVRSIKFSGSIAHIVWQHHERMDGSGYPQGLNGDQIMLEARILAVADVVEAMTAHRPYRPALGLEKALDEITRNRATLYDAQAVDACLALFNNKGFQFQV